jgi:putative ABC transport system permease protein
LFGRSLLRLLAIDPGFRTEHVVTTDVVLPASKYATPASQVEFYRRFLASVREIPGVE